MQTDKKQGRLEAIRAAFRFLAPRDRFESEVRQHLARKCFESDVVENVVKFLLERKLLNDDQTTQRLIERNSGKRSVGLERLRAELETLGAPEEVISAGLSGLEIIESERALAALRAKYRPGTDRAKAGRFLYSRGFAEDAIESALDAFCEPAND